MASIKDSDTRSRIYDAAVDLFFYKGYGGTSLRDIADIAAINVATIYHYFPSKQALLLQIIEETLTKLYDSSQIALASSTTPVDALKALTASHVIFHCDDQRQAVITDREINSFPINIRKGEIAARDRYEAVWDTVLRDGHVQGYFGIEDLQLARFALLAMCSQVAAWYQPVGRLTPREIADVYTLLALRVVGYSSP